MVFGSSHIEIGKYKFIDKCNSAVINMDWRELVQYAELKLPNIKRQLEKVINKGDQVVIKLGYNDNLVEEFRGYVSEVIAGTPVVIKCMDDMYNLKQRSVTKSWKSTTLKEVLSYLVPDADVNCPDITLSPFRLDRVTVFDALKKLKDDYALVIYFRSGTLFCGLAYQEDAGAVKYRLTGINANCKAGDLKFMSASDVKIKLTAISILPNNTSITVELGDEDGERRTLHFYNLNEQELRQQAEERINLLKYDGYRGNLTAFGVPFAQFGMTATLYDDLYPEREGQYFIDSVRTTYSVSAGFRRVVTLGRKSIGTTLITA